MNINTELNKIIIKYNIDKPYRRFKDYLRAAELLNKLIAKYDGDILFIVNTKRDFLYMNQDIETDKEFEHVCVDICNEKSFDTIKSSKNVVVASYNYNKEISVILSDRGIKNICLYDYFALNGLNIEYDYYNIFGGT